MRFCGIVESNAESAESCGFCDSQNLNGSDCGVAFVFVKIFGLSTRLESVEVRKFSQVRKMRPRTNCKAESPKFLQVRNRIPQDKLSADSAKFLTPYSNTIFRLESGKFNAKIFSFNK